MTEQVATIITEEPPKVVEVSPEQKTADTLYPEGKPEAETSPVEEKKPEAEASQTPPSEEKPAEEVKYELKLPEGSLLDQARIKEVEDYAKSKNISPDVAQEILERESNSIAAFHQAQQEQIKQETTKWFEASKTDKEVGGAHFTESAEFAKRTIEKFGTPELKKALNETGLGNHPEALRVFARIGKELFKNDEFVRPGASARNSQPIEDMFYPTNKRN